MNNINNIAIHTHLGMGDMFICNGLIRRFISESNYEKYYILCKKKYYNTIKKIYKDEEKIIVIPIDAENAGDEYKEVKNLKINGHILRIGHEKLQKIQDNYNCNFDEAFYKQMNYSIEDKFKWSSIARDGIKEIECYEAIVNSEDYIFVHDKSSVGEFDLKIQTDYDIIKPNNMNYGLIDWLTVISKAKEIHCIDSSFLNMVDLIPTNCQCFFHNIKKTECSVTLSKKSEIVKYD